MPSTESILSKAEARRPLFGSHPPQTIDVDLAVRIMVDTLWCGDDFACRQHGTTRTSIDRLHGYRKLSNALESAYLAELVGVPRQAYWHPGLMLAWCSRPYGVNSVPSTYDGRPITLRRFAPLRLV